VTRHDLSWLIGDLVADIATLTTTSILSRHTKSPVRKTQRICSSIRAIETSDHSWPFPAVQAIKSTRGCPTATCDCQFNRSMQHFIGTTLLRENVFESNE
jgi:hypothetical protein